MSTLNCFIDTGGCVAGVIELRSSECRESKSESERHCHVNAQAYTQRRRRIVTVETHFPPPPPIQAPSPWRRQNEGRFLGDGLKSAPQLTFLQGIANNRFLLLFIAKKRRKAASSSFNKTYLRYRRTAH